MKVEDIKKVAKQLNEIVQPDPPIKINTKSTTKELLSEIEEVIQIIPKELIISTELFEKIKELGFTLPRGVQVKEGVKKEKDSIGKEETATKKNNKRSKDSEMKYVSELIGQKKYSRKDIIDMYLKKFPNSTKNTINSLLSHGKNPKYNDFEKLIKENKEGILSF